MGKKKRNKRKKTLKEERITESLNEKNKLFCILYVQDKECFGNATKSYQRAYNTTYETAKTAGNRLLTNVHILAYLNKLLDDFFKDECVDRALSHVMQQNKDLPAKVSAIKEYNKLKQRVTEKTDITSGGEKITGINYIVPTQAQKNGANN